MDKFNYTMLCDFYELTMGNGYFVSGMQEKISYFDLFFRQIPDGGGFAIACGLEQVKHQTAGDGLAAAVLLILTGIAQQRANRGDGTRGSTLQRINHDELFHDPLVDIARMTLQHEHVRTAHRFGETHVHLAIGKVIGRGFEDFGSQAFGHLLS